MDRMRTLVLAKLRSLQSTPPATFHVSVRGLSPKLFCSYEKEARKKVQSHARDIMIVHKFKVLVGVAHEIQIL